MDRPTIPFEAGSPILVAGPTQCGKTYWVNRLLLNDMFTQPVASVLYCYGVYQDFFRTMRDNPQMKIPLQFHKGLPSQNDLEALADKRFHIVVLDDLMEHIVKSQEMQQLFTKYCHHLNLSAIFISQNLFQPGPHARSISLNVHVVVLFSNKRDESQIRTFARQIYPTKWKRFLQVYEREMKYEFSYLVVDCTPSHPRDIKVRMNIFPGEITYTYDI